MAFEVCQQPTVCLFVCITWCACIIRQAFFFSLTDSKDGHFAVHAASGPLTVAITKLLFWSFSKMFAVLNTEEMLW